MRRFAEEVPALQGLKLVVGLELRGGRDLQIYRVQLPGPQVSKDIPADAKVTLSMQRARFNELATRGRLADWRAAFEHGEARATGVEQVLRLIVSVVERHEQRTRTRRARPAGRPS
ncbi:MAG TPA: hypothetical protein VKV27_04090 [Solirubrobacteraceae bacterium]|nr:hypothetical protein [Solirubrobacteraceae bacterium]